MRVCFEAVTRDTDLAGARLELEEVPACARCQQCHHEFPVTENWFECPRCKSIEAEILSGQELDLTGIELVESAT